MNPKGISKLPSNLMAKKSLLIKILAIVLLVLLCCNLPALLFWPLCWKQDHNLLPNSEVIISACLEPGAFGVPGGEFLFVREGRTKDMYLLDLHTGGKRDVSNDPLLIDHGVFLSSELVWLVGSYGPPGGTGFYRPHYILDLTDGQRYELLDLDWLPRLDGGKFNPQYYTYIRLADQFFLHHSNNTLIALSSDFRTNPDGRVIFSQNSLVPLSEGYKNGELLEQLMKDLGLKYEIVDLSLQYANVPSPTGRYVVRNDGIYLSETNTPVVTREYTGGAFMGGYFRSWYYDESGVVVQGGGHDLILLPGGGGIFYIPSPILKLRLP